MNFANLVTYIILFFPTSGLRHDTIIALRTKPRPMARVSTFSPIEMLGGRRCLLVKFACAYSTFTYSVTQPIDFQYLHDTVSTPQESANRNLQSQDEQYQGRETYENETHSAAIE